MIKELWRKKEILPVLFTMLCSVTCLSIGATSLAQNNKKNHTAEINQYIPAEMHTIHTPKVPLKRGKYDQSVKTNPRKQRYRRHVMQMARMLKCMSGCNPLSYRGYGCFCGYMGSGQPVDDIDRCCLQHDWCYSFISCPQSLIYFVPYTWQCMNPGAAHCGIASVPGVSQKCATQLCECDREFARCVSNYPCPRKKPGCTASNFVLLQTITKNEI